MHVVQVCHVEVVWRGTMSVASHLSFYFKALRSEETASPPSVISFAILARRRATWLWMAFLLLAYVVLNTSILWQTVHHPDRALKMQSKDSRQYIEIAHDFAQGDFSMAYVQNMPHRQPLYSMALAPVIKLWGEDNLLMLGAVNVAAGLVLLVGLYWGLLLIFGRYLVAVLSCLTYIANPFMVDKIACRLMTEPLHALFLTALILLFLRYVRYGQRYQLWGIAAAAGADYLVRTNGLFVAAAAFGALLLHDGWNLLKREGTAVEKTFVQFQRKALGYLGAALIFVVTTAPSWLPRYHYFRNPIYHGYLSNFLWVDSYEQGHTGQARSDFGWKDYASHHDLRETAARWTTGFYHVYYDIPRHTEHVRILYFLAVGGLVVSILQRRRDFCLLTGCMFVQMLPVVWTSVSNPGPRVPYGTMFPFELAFAALALNCLAGLVTARKSQFTISGANSGCAGSSNLEKDSKQPLQNDLTVMAQH